MIIYDELHHEGKDEIWSNGSAPTNVLGLPLRRLEQSWGGLPRPSACNGRTEADVLLAERNDEENKSEARYVRNPLWAPPTANLRQ